MPRTRLLPLLAAILFVLAGATPASHGQPRITDETLEVFDFQTVEPGDIVGTSGSPLGARATIWPLSGGIQDLNALIPAGNDFVLTQAVNINNPGTILAIGHDDQGQGAGHAAQIR